MPSQPRREARRRLTVEWTVDERVAEGVDRDFLTLVLEEALSGRKVGAGLEVGLTITTDEGIRELNERYRKVDAITDVLSFPMLEYERPEEAADRFPLPPGKPLSLGDIVLSYPRAVEQAHIYGHSLERELAFLAVHGAMHLLGYDHESAEGERQMRAEEEAVLARLNLSR